MTSIFISKSDDMITIKNALTVTNFVWHSMETFVIQFLNLNFNLMPNNAENPISCWLNFNMILSYRFSTNSPAIKCLTFVLSSYVFSFYSERSRMCRKTFYNIHHFYGFSHNLLQKSFRAAHSQKICKREGPRKRIKLTMRLIVSVLRASSAGISVRKYSFGIPSFPTVSNQLWMNLLLI